MLDLWSASGSSIATLCVLILVGQPVVGTHGIAQDALDATSVSCDWGWELVEERRLAVPGLGPVFIDVTDFDRSEDATAVVGRQSIVWGEDSSGQDAQMNTAMGVVLSDDGGQTLIPAPEDWVPPATANVVHLPGGPWLITWLEATPATSSASDEDLGNVTLLQAEFADGEFRDVRAIAISVSGALLAPYMSRSFVIDGRPFLVMGSQHDGRRGDFLLVLERLESGEWLERVLSVPFSSVLVVEPPWVFLAHNHWGEAEEPPVGMISGVDLSDIQPKLVPFATLEGQNVLRSLTVRKRVGTHDFIWHSRPRPIIGPIVEMVSVGPSGQSNVRTVARYEQNTQSPGVIVSARELPFLWFRPAASDDPAVTGGVTLDVVTFDSMRTEGVTQIGRHISPYVSQRFQQASLLSDGRSLLLGGVEADGRLFTVLSEGQLSCVP